MPELRRRTLLSAIGVTAAAGSVATSQATVAHAADGGREAPYESEVRSLLSRMTLEEKLGQLQQLPWAYDLNPGSGSTKEVEDAARSGRLGSVLSIFGARTTNALQKLAVEESRLGIPLLFGLDVIHGFWTNFPIPLAQAAAFDPDVARSDAEVSAKEARSNGVHWTFAPMMDVTHEPRWGRIAEGNGEDPCLTSRLAAAKVEGYQGSGYRTKDRLAACAKHFVAYGGAEGGRDYNTVDVSESRLRNLYLPPFKAALDAGVATVMASFNTISGVPAHGNAHTLTGILKKEWGFEGMVVSDWTGVQELIAHGFAEDGADAARLALNAGVDMEMTSTNLLTNGRKLLRSGKITEKRIDDAVARVLGLKYALGLFDDPYVDESAAITEPSANARKAARAAAARSMVLLKNDAGVLPLSRSVGSLAVVGPFADSADLLGTWVVPASAEKFPAVKILDAVKRAAPDAKVTYARGVDPEGADTGGIDEAVAAAKAADVTVVVVGEPTAMSGEASARSDISLPGAQEKLVTAIAATGKPFVVVLVNGRPLTIGDWLERAPAVLEAWHPGTEAGNAVADVLFGAVNPGGKLPVSFPRTVGQIPIHYNHESTGRPYDANNKYTSKYLDLPPTPQFPFGFGLSYTTFDLGTPKLSRANVPAGALRKGDTVEVSVSVRNTGDHTGDEVVQLYVRDVAASITQPVRRLRGFKRVTLDAGRSATVRFPLGAEDLGFWTNDPNGEFRLEEGTFKLYVGTSSTADAELTLTVT
ncbi:glycoside hydrolase family 3 N-terminal domain-containing protein [Streptomyces sp. VRA16 Mangrove soil]|uniref:glycoside hydrolase family 3 N-terminal domain-containing protein n=1 Tax=Streptomyces sp. VRA16 Mangrove soil TaxID=2817434 RepID=UPI001A9D0D50|nr:glycoside hydrolase family 3 N-terminal domain-containing protein [Streptomyces sp. VRA16 Mangrove soil]MBO1332152.1 glycoside hydrolase family 3 C-terminal domain-containing protein [Streptomyces sp. VRA16 Mangrove soil]